MSREYAWVNTQNYAHRALIQVSEAMCEDSTYAASVLMAGFVQSVSHLLVYQAANAEAADAHYESADVVRGIDALIEKLQTMRTRIPELIEAGNGKHLLTEEERDVCA